MCECIKYDKIIMLVKVYIIKLNTKVDVIVTKADVIVTKIIQDVVIL